MTKNEGVFIYLCTFGGMQTVIGEPLPMDRVAATKLPSHFPSIGVGSECSSPSRLNEMQPWTWMPAPKMPVTLISPVSQESLVGGGVVADPVSFPLPVSVCVPGKFDGRLSLWSLNPVT